MALILNPNGRKVYVIRRISTNEVLHKRVPYPGPVDDAPLPNQDPDIELLAMDRDALPAVDGNYYAIQVNEEKQGNLWKISFTAQKRSPQALRERVTSIGEREFLRHFPTGDATTFMFLCLGALDKARRGTALLAGETARLNALQTRYAKILQNAQNLATLITAIDGGAEPNMNSGWATP